MENSLVEKIKESNSGAYSILQSMVNYLFILNFNGETLLVSQSIVEDTKFSMSEFQKNSINDFLIDHEGQFSIFDQLLLGVDDRKHVELGLNCKDGSVIPVMVLSTNFLEEFWMGEDLLLVLCADLRGQKKAQALLIESSKMASLGQMSSSLAHELNNPLTIMEGQLRRLVEYVQDEEVTLEERVDLIGKVQKNLGRAVKIIKSFRSISRKSDQDPFQSESLKSIVAETKELIQHKIENKNIELEIVVPEQDIELNCRKSGLLQVFINLIANSIDAIEDREDDKWIHVKFKRKKDILEIYIVDSGEGVSLETQVRLFEPFYTTKDIGKGTGLGLSVSRNIIEDHGGKIQYLQESKNSCFLVKLPLKRTS